MKSILHNLHSPRTIALNGHEAQGPGVEYRWSCGEGLGVGLVGE